MLLLKMMKEGTMEKLYNLSEIGRAMNVTPGSVSVWLRNGIIPQPKYEVGNALVWTPQQLGQIKKTITARRKLRAKGTRS